MTERLYYTDPYATEFEAEIVRHVEPSDGRLGLVLDRTAFCPTSGGQPFDTGTIGGSRVIDVIDADDGTIVHVVDANAADPGRRLSPSTRAAGRIDWERRFDHMQQHTGQHVLSAAFDRVVGARTVSFHMGAESSTIDLAREVSSIEIVRAEDEANRIVWQNRAVTIRFADAAEAAKLPLRKESAREGTLRLVDVSDYDLSACGGTHVGRTGEIGVIAIGSTERIRGGSRVEFFCGGRALRAHRTLRDIVSAGTKAASVGAVELPAAIERLLGEVKELKRGTKDLHSRLATYEAEALASRAEAIGPTHFTFAAIDGADANRLKQVAAAIVNRSGHAVVVISAPSPSFIVVTRSADVSMDGSVVLKRMIERFGGRGGGRADLAQGGGLEGSTEEMLAYARAVATPS